MYEYLPGEVVVLCAFRVLHVCVSSAPSLRPWSSWTINGAGSCLVKLDLKRSTPFGEGWPWGARGAFFPPSVPFPPPGFGRTCALVVGLEMATTGVHHPTSGQAWDRRDQG